MQVGERLVIESRAAWQAWLSANHATAREIWLVSFRRSASPRALAHPIACDEAICFGWKEGPSQMLDDDSFATRFTPRAPDAAWSDADLARARRLAGEGRLRAAGIVVLPLWVRKELQAAEVLERVLDRARADLREARERVASAVPGSVTQARGQRGVARYELRVEVLKAELKASRE